MTKPNLKVILTNPRGFCAGVVRAIDIVERALKKFGAPVYVRHEIVHNKFVVNSLRDKGAVFIKELDEVPDKDAERPVIFSAHGVPKRVPNEAQRRNLFYVDATCPLVSKVHREAERNHADGRTLLLIGHTGHPEVIGTMGQLPDGAVILIETINDAHKVEVPDPDALAYVTQTTLSVDDTADIVAALIERFPNIKGPKAQDICYATTNRQEAVKAIAGQCDAFITVGAPNSSNSNRLVEVAERAGVNKSFLIERASDIDWDLLGPIKILGLSAGASAPEVLVQEIIDACAEHYEVTVENAIIREEKVKFKVPKVLTDTAA